MIVIVRYSSIDTLAVSLNVNVDELHDAARIREKHVTVSSHGMSRKAGEEIRPRLRVDSALKRRVARGLEPD